MSPSLKTLIDFKKMCVLSHNCLFHNSAWIPVLCTLGAVQLEYGYLKSLAQLGKVAYLNYTSHCGQGLGILGVVGQINNFSVFCYLETQDPVLA